MGHGSASGRVDVPWLTERRRRPTRLERFVDGPFLRSAVHCALDGLVTTFTTICASMGVAIAVVVMVAMGSANLFGDALTIAVNDAISSDVERRRRYTVADRNMTLVRDWTARNAAAAAGYVERRVVRHVSRRDPSTASASAASLLLHAAATPGAPAEQDASFASALRALEHSAEGREMLARCAAFGHVDAEALESPPDDGDDDGDGNNGNNDGNGTDWKTPIQQGVVAVVAFLGMGCLPLLSLYAGAELSGSARVGFATSAVVTLSSITVLGALNARLSNISLRRGIALILSASLATMVAVYGMSSLIDLLLPAEWRDATTCNFGVDSFVRAPPR